MVVPSSLPGRERLRSADSLNYDICHTRLKFTEHSFAVSSPTAWRVNDDTEVLGLWPSGQFSGICGGTSYGQTSNPSIAWKK